MGLVKKILLQYLSLVVNEFEEGFFLDLSYVGSFVYFNFLLCNRNGFILDLVGELQSLVYLDLFYNYVIGFIFENLFLIINIMILDFFYNNLNGQIFLVFGLLNLSSLDFFFNNLIGEVLNQWIKFVNMLFIGNLFFCGIVNRFCLVGDIFIVFLVFFLLNFFFDFVLFLLIDYFLIVRGKGYIRKDMEVGVVLGIVIGFCLVFCVLFSIYMLFYKKCKRFKKKFRKDNFSYFIGFLMFELDFCGWVC